MIKENEILVTGGKGLLASEIQKLIKKGQFAGKSVLDVSSEKSVNKYFEKNKVSLVIHTAALLPPIKSQETPIEAIKTNIIGTANIVNACIEYDARLFFISTDYVFKGDKGNYNEESELYPINEYAWTKLGGECCVRLHNNSLIIRTTFGPKEFPYPKAFEDQYTSREPVDKIAAKIVKLISTNAKGVIHLGGKRQTVYDYAKALPNTEHVEPMKTTDLDIDYKLPNDTSLNVEKYERLIN